MARTNRKADTGNEHTLRKGTLEKPEYGKEQLPHQSESRPGEDAFSKPDSIPKASSSFPDESSKSAVITRARIGQVIGYEIPGNELSYEVSLLANRRAKRQKLKGLQSNYSDKEWQARPEHLEQDSTSSQLPHQQPFARPSALTPGNEPGSAERALGPPSTSFTPPQAQSQVFEHTTSESTTMQPNFKDEVFADQNLQEHASCLGCGDEKPSSELFRAPCEHYYCADCLDARVNLAIEEEAYFPADCCHVEWPMGRLDGLIEASIFIEYGERGEEYMNFDRIYCSRPSCGAWISPAEIANNSAFCLKCQQSTCPTCKKASHYGECVADEGTQQLNETASSAGWKRCYRCKMLVSKSEGCNQMRYVSHLRTTDASIDFL